MSIYLHDWAGSGEAGMLADFEIDKAALDGATVLVASYTYEDYSGDAYVLFERGGNLFEVHGGHCSCYGLEGQWEPEEADADAIRHRISAGTWGEEVKVRDVVLAALDRVVA